LGGITFFAPFGQKQDQTLWYLPHSANFSLARRTLSPPSGKKGRMRQFFSDTVLKIAASGKNKPILSHNI
jgi:hypothetical protein